MLFNLHNEFSEIRSLMHLPMLNVAQRHSLWETLLRIAHTHPEVYASEWVPYLRGFPHHWIKPLFHTANVRAHHLSQIESWCALAPFAHFHLDISSRASSQDLWALFHSTSFTQVNTLTLHHIPLPNPMMHGVHSRPNLAPPKLGHASTQDKRLEMIDLSQNHIAYSALDMLEVNSFKSLKKLILSGNPFNSKALAIFLMTPVAARFGPSLTHLDLNQITFTPEAMSSLCDPHLFASLTHLTLSQTGLNDRAIQVLMDSGIMGRLTSLDLQFTHGIHDTMRQTMIDRAHARHPGLMLKTPASKSS